VYLIRPIMKPMAQILGHRAERRERRGRGGNQAQPSSDAHGKSGDGLMNIGVEHGLPPKSHDQRDCRRARKGKPKRDLAEKIHNLAVII
jgi:hypothetical protein